LDGRRAALPGGSPTGWAHRERVDKPIAAVVLLRGFDGETLARTADHHLPGRALKHSRLLKPCKANLARACKRATAPTTLRHTFRTRIAAGGRRSERCRKWTGRRDFKTRLIYADY
jgi:hypothetical protein